MVQRPVPEVFAELADEYGWEALLYAAMVGVTAFGADAARRWTDQYSRRQEEDFFAFDEMAVRLDTIRHSLTGIPRPVEDWFKRRER
jgi:hypothetical protein